MYDLLGGLHCSELHCGLLSLSNKWLQSFCVQNRVGNSIDIAFPISIWLNMSSEFITGIISV